MSPLSHISRLFGLLLITPGLRAQNQGPVATTPIPDQIVFVGADSTAIDLTNYLTDPDISSPAVRMDIRIGTTTKPVYFALLPEAAPLTVANFIRYIEAGRFAANIIHRSASNFVIQGGGFLFDGPQSLNYVPTFPAVPNEPNISNTRGTVAMAKQGTDPNSATSQWFVNLGNNSTNLDNQNGGFTVFARVVGSGMTVIDEVAAVPFYNATSQLGSAFDTVPLTAAVLSRENFIETDATLVQALAFTVSSDAPEILDATVDADGVLTLSPAANQSGLATISITSTDLEGATLSSSFRVNVIHPDSFAAWVLDQPFAEEADAAFDADPDGDGRANLIEYAFDTDPLVGSSINPAPRLLANGDLEIPYYPKAKLGLTAEISSDLRNWEPVWTTADGELSPRVVDVHTMTRLPTITIRAGDTATSSRYWRVVVSDAVD